MIAVQRPGLIERIEHIAQESNRDTTQIVEEALRAYLDQLEREAIHKETEAYWGMQADLVAHYPDEYVAIYQGQVVDHDPDITHLEQRVAERLGEATVLIAPVTAAPRRDLSTVSFRLESGSVS